MDAVMCDHEGASISGREDVQQLQRHPASSPDELSPRQPHHLTHTTITATHGCNKAEIIRATLRSHGYGLCEVTAVASWQWRGLFGAQPTLVWPSKQPSRVALHSSARCPQIDLYELV